MNIDTDWLLTPQRAALHLPTATAVVADLHLGYRQARRAAGDAVPDVSLNQQLRLLADLFNLQEVKRLVVAGDLVEDSRLYRPALDFVKWLNHYGVELAGLVPGNHDQHLPAGLFPLFQEGYQIGDWSIQHGDGLLPSGKVILGHFHPVARWSNSLSGHCFLVRPDRMVLPAYSDDAAGGNVVGQKRWRGFRCCVIAGDKVLDFGEMKRIKEEGQQWKPEA
jgi:metallophosphoesterase superfamily enzyme